MQGGRGGEPGNFQDDGAKRVGVCFASNTDLELWTEEVEQGVIDNMITLSVEGVFQMAYILPERLLALVRPAFDLVLRRIQSLKRCAQACGCKIMTPRYACNLAPGCISSEPTFAGLRKNKKKRKQGVPKKGSRKKGKRGFLWQSLTSLEMQPGAKLQRISRGHYFAATRLHAAF